MGQVALPDKLFFRIGEVARIVGVRPHVLRYWETEFPSLSPNKSKSGQRVYSQKELDTIRRIKELLYDEGYTIAGAKKRLETELEDGEVGESVKAAGKPPAAEAGREEKRAAAAAVLDTDAAEKIKTFRRGIEDALGQTREILDLLASRT